MILVKAILFGVKVYVWHLAQHLHSVLVAKNNEHFSWTKFFIMLGRKPGLVEIQSYYQLTVVELAFMGSWWSHSCPSKHTSHGTSVGRFYGEAND